MSYTKGTKVWFPDKELGWISGQVTSKETNEAGQIVLSFVDEKGKESTVNASSEASLLSSEGLPPLRNPPLLENQEDLANLSNLNEPSVLHAISTRYHLHLPYTYSGIVLIAINPFYPLQIYGQDMIQSYSGRRKGELEPHLFAIAEEALDCMRRGQTAGGEVGGTADQTIVVSGESGAGKTVSAKYILRYFASVDDPTRPVRRQRQKATTNSSPSAEDAGMSEVERQMLATNPIMEAFGNAKTTRNDNSSRFGKYMEILFDKDQEIVGARIRTYLLERSRIVYQPESERNYHIFYQLCAGAPAKERKDLGLDIDPHKFNYLSQGGSKSAVIPGVDDAVEFGITQKALSTVGVSVEKQWQIFRLLAALLHLGNIQITQSRTDAMISDDDTSLAFATTLLGVPKDEFRKWTVKKQLVTRSEKIVSSLSGPGATVVRDSVAKFVYACIWEYLVAVVNESLMGEGGTAALVAEKFIGVLDIYGFEHFKKNSLEQFFINYANEKLQQQFNAHVFKLEQEEYVREKINWTFIDFSDNQPCIDVIEGKLGILSLLDEESRLPSGADASFVQKLYKQLDVPDNKKIFKKPRFGGSSFTVAHYAVDVEYEAEGFIEKNRDTVPDEHLALLQNTTNTFLKEALDAVLNPPTSASAVAAAPVAPEIPSAINKRSSILSSSHSAGRSPALASMAAPQTALTVSKKPGGRKPTLGSIFKGSLISLMDTISKTNVHYIRCIKPNEKKAAWEWDATQVLGQLRACGVLETIRISCAGYPSRWAFDDFAERYYMLIRSEHWQKELKDVCSLILDDTIKEEDKYQVGLTKIFFRAGMLAYLEALRAERLNALVTLVQKNLRRRVAANRYKALKTSTVRIQAWWRGVQARKQVETLRRETAAVKIQRVGRGFLQRQQYRQSKAAAVKIQSVVRGFQSRRAYKEQRLQLSATNLQRLCKGLLLRKRYEQEIRSVIHLQSCIRRRMARRELQKLKVEARSATKFKEISYKLENKVVELTQALQKREGEKKKLQAQIKDLEEAQAVWTGKHEEASARATELHTELQKPTVPQARFEELQRAKDSTDARLGETLKTIKEREAMVASLGEQIVSQTKLLDERQALLEQATARAADDATTLGSLRSEIAGLRESLNRANALAVLSRNAPPPTSPNLSNGLRALENGPTDISAPMEQRPSKSHNRRHSAGLAIDTGRTRDPDDQNMYDARKAQNAQNRSASVAVFAPDAVSWLKDSSGMPIGYDDPNEQIMRMLEDAEHLDEDVLTGLIKALKIPVPTLQSIPTHKEVVFPAHLIGLVTNEMWKFGLIPESERFLANVMQTIQQHVMSFQNEDAIIPGIFWLSNVHELLSFVCVAEHDIGQGIGPGQDDGIGRPFEWEDYERLVQVVKHDLDSLEYNIYHTWIAETKKKLTKMVVPALIESQSLPGFMTNEGGGRLFNRLIQGSSGPAFSMDDILNILNKIWKALKGYHMEDSVTQQVVAEILKLIGVTAFNDLLMRRNFSSWKRAMQIQYNITRLEEWCKSHDMPEGVLQLEHLMQATKLLQLKKGTQADIDIIYDVCWMLTPTQIQKLITQYHVADYETPIPSEILRAVASRISANDRSDHLLLPSETEEAGPYELPAPRDIEYLETFVPSYLNIPHIRRFAMQAAG
ncbi:myosin 5 [Phaffia rhodozyma]|uniref:Myosin 5 n=1 Tax=Phaffia rhodozyma TaxID=264483 RepID=A0A0F7SR07_PHARH|nr:myosin 5 [Phaffia rhodozyma]